MKGILKLGFILAVFATAACVGLAFVYSATKQIIDQRAQADLEDALQELFPTGDGFEDISGALVSDSPSAQFGSQYAISQGSTLIGVALQVTQGSYGGLMTTLVGVRTDGKISQIKILEHSDTPGLGANAASPSYFVNRAEGITFHGQFSGKSVQDPFQVHEDVSAITAATITSRSVSSAVQIAGRAAHEWLQAQEAKNE